MLRNKLIEIKEANARLNRYRNAIIAVACLVSIILFVVSFLLYNYKMPPKFLHMVAPTGTIYEDVYNRSVNLSLFTKKEYKYLDNSNGISGTAWILDYELEPYYIGWYPKTFYYGTNVHVACHYNSFDFCHAVVWTGILDNYGNVTNEKFVYPESASIIYSGLNFIKPNYINQINASIKLSYHANNSLINYQQALFPEVRNQLIFGESTKIDDLWAQNRFFAPMIDFAVIKIVFRTIEDARFTTHNFADRQIATNFFPYTEYNYLTFHHKRLFIGGYPYSVWSINSSPEEKEKNDFSGKSVSPYLGSRNGIFFTDIFFGSARIWRQYGNEYIHYGVQLIIPMSSLGPGSSGSVVCDEMGNIVGIHWGGDKCLGNDATHVLINEYQHITDENSIYGHFRQQVVQYNVIRRNNFSTSYEEALRLINPFVRTYLFH